VERYVSVVPTEASSCGFAFAQSIIRIKSRRNGGGWEDRYYVSSIESDAYTPQQWAARIQAHWSVENKNHWRKDATLGEDATRSRQPNILSNLMLLRQLTLYFYEKHGRRKHRWLKSWVEENQRSTNPLLGFIGV